MGTCSRCGRQTETEYGSDGMAYCSACSFYGQNKQCWKCRMYVPASELQQYRGQWTCPVCLQDMRSESTRSQYKEEQLPMRAISYSETCERCGRDSELLYRWNGRNLCKPCLNEEQESWGIVGGGPSGAGAAVRLEPIKVTEEESMFEDFISTLLALFGIKKKKKTTTIVAVHAPAMPIGYAKPMAEENIKKKKEQPKPKSEGLMTKAEKKSAKKNVSFPEYKPEETQEKKNPFKDHPYKKKKP